MPPAMLTDQKSRLVRRWNVVVQLRLLAPSSPAPVMSSSLRPLML
jgi:hypothetical protein